MQRIYHRYELWECYKNGFFNTCTGEERKELSEKVVELFSDFSQTNIFMRRVISEWIFSSQHNLTNVSMNRVAWLGQSACCIYASAPFGVTMEAWHLVPSKHQEEANNIAEVIIKEYESNSDNFQLCLKFI